MEYKDSQGVVKRRQEIKKRTGRSEKRKAGKSKKKDRQGE
jgi:hypothetical protein